MASNKAQGGYNPELYQVGKTNKFVKVLIYIGLVIWALINLFPIYYMFTFSLKDNEEIFGKNAIGLPTKWIWSNFANAWSRANMPRNFANSILVSTVAIAITLIAAIMATYAMTRIKWKGSALLNSIFMLGITIPIHVALYPIYVLISKTHMTSTYTSLIVPYAAFSLSMAIMVCTGFMNDIPKELDEAACIDGCGLGRTFFYVIAPLMKPALATVGIYTFLQCWNEFMFASVFINDSSHKTLPVGIAELSGRTTTDWGIVGAGLTLATFPMLLVYVFLSRKIQESFMAGAIKG